eukprot:11939270-Alexandrium_andersonii.AAC.1
MPSQSAHRPAENARTRQAFGARTAQAQGLPRNCPRHSAPNSCATAPDHYKRACRPRELPGRASAPARSDCR